LTLAVGLAASPMVLAPGTALAEDGDPVLIGQTNESCTGGLCFPTYATTLLWGHVEYPRSVFVVQNRYGNGQFPGESGNTGPAITGDAGGLGTGVQGLSFRGAGVYGQSEQGAGVQALSNGAAATTTIAANRSGVYGENTGGAGWGVVGRTNADLKPGVWGDNVGGGNGVYGLSNGPFASGVYGFNTSQGYGVAGRTASTERAATLGDNTGAGPGVVGESAAGTGVVGISHGAGAAGVSGDATASNGIGVRAMASAGGTALSVTGKAKFSRSGMLTIPAGASQVTKTGLTLNTASFLLATLQAYRAGIAVAAVVPNPTAGSFTIYLTKAVTSSTRVAWFQVN
jgi:hypothetical protein